MLLKGSIRDHKLVKVFTFADLNNWNRVPTTTFLSDGNALLREAN